MFEKVLVPTDFSILSRRVLECVACCPQVEDAVKERNQAAPRSIYRPRQNKIGRVLDSGC